MVARLRRIPWLPAAVFVLATLAFMPGPLLGQSTYGAVDMIELGSPYRDAIGRPPYLESPVQLDQLEEFPWAQAFFDSIREGDWPSWDPNAGAGVPSGTLPLKGVLSPFSAGFLVLPGWYALGLKVALTLLFCQAFTYLLVRRLGAGRGAATLAGLAYTFSGVNIVFIHRVSAQMVLPAMLWAAHRLVEQPSFRRAAPLAALVAWAWFEGFPSGFVYCVYLTAAWCGWLIVRRRPFRVKQALRTGAQVTAAFVLGVALAAVNLFPFLAEVTRRGILERRQYGATTHLPSRQYYGLFDLDAIGRYPDGEWWSGVNPMESISHFGMIVGLAMGLGLAAAALGRLHLTRPGREAWPFFSGLAAIGLILNYAGGPLLTAAYQVPGIANNLITRSRFILPLSAAVLAALSLDALWNRMPAAAGRKREESGSDEPAAAREPAPRVISALTLGTFAYMALAYFPEYRQVAAAARQGDIILASAARNLALALLAAGLALAARRWRGWVPGITALIAVLLFFQLAYPLRNFTPDAPIAAYYSEQRGHRVLKQLVGDDHRFAAAGRFTFSLNSGQIFEIPDLRGMALPSREFRALAEAVSPEAFSQFTLGLVIPRDAWDLSNPLLDDLAVRYFALGTEERPFGVTAYEDTSPGEWTPIAGGFVEGATFTAPGPITGIAVPIKGTDDCAYGSMTLTLSSKGRTIASSSRPSFDVLSDWLHYGLHQERKRLTDWYWFALDGQSLQQGDQYSLGLSASNPGCELSAGALGTGPEVRPAVQVLAPDPSYPLRLVSTEQAWIYERPTAWDLVSSHSLWLAFDSQQDALAYASSRLDEQREVVAYVGEEVPLEPGAAPAELSGVRWGDDRVSFATSGESRSLVVVSQNADQGWTARVDGREVPIVKVDGVLAGIFVPPGQHRVEMEYRPTTFVLSAWISGAAALTLAGSVAPWRRRRSDAG